MKTKGIAIVCGIAFLILTPVLVIADSSFGKPPYDSRPPIVIVGDGDLTDENGVRSGKGTPEDPYLIDGWHIAIGTSGESGISLRNTTAHTVISNITLVSYYPRNHTCAISLEDVANCTVRDCTIRDGRKIGILARCPSLEGTCGLRFINNIFADQNVGIDLEEVRWAEISHNVFLRMTGAGVEVRLCAQVSISDNLVVDPWESGGIRVSDSEQISVERAKMKLLHQWEYDYGIDMQNVTGMTIRDSHFNYRYGSGPTVRVLRSNDIEIVGCEFRVGSPNAVSVNLSSRCLIRDNEFYLTGVTIMDSLHQWVKSNRFWESKLIIESSENVSVSDNSLVSQPHPINFKTGYISVTGIFNLSIDHNCILGAFGAGVDVRQGAHVMITGNIIRDCVQGWDSSGMAVRISSVSDLNISENRIGDNVVVEEDPNYRYDEVYLFDCDGAVLYGNFLSHNSVYIASSVSPVIRLNTFSGEGCLSLSYVEDGLVCTNNFVDGHSACLLVENDTKFDSGYPVGGNHWSSHIGADLYSGPNQDIPGPDGIVDTPYVGAAAESVGVVVDNYPLLDTATMVDHESPITLVALEGDRRRTASVWHIGNVTVNLTARDALTEVDLTLYRVDGGEWREYESPFEISSNGRHLLEFYSTDVVENTERVRSKDVWIDKERPTIGQLDPSLNSTVTRSVVVVRFSASDDMSGISLVGWSVGDHYDVPGVVTINSEAVIAEPRSGELAFTLYAMDEAGNAIGLDGIYVFDTEPLSLTGPYGPWFVIGVIADFVLLAVLAVHLERSYVAIMDARIGEVRWPDKDRPGAAKVQETKEDVEDGYPKYMRKV